MSYTFNNLSHMSADKTDNTQRNIYNTRYGNYNISNYYGDVITPSEIDFVSHQPTMVLNGYKGGSGYSGSIIDANSALTIGVSQERPLEKLQLFQRPFVTVPYLGRGYGDPAIESQLLQGEMTSDRKSVGTVSEKSYMPYTNYPLLDEIKNNITNPSNLVEESALNGWVRGGSSTRDLPIDFSKKQGVF